MNNLIIAPILIPFVFSIILGLVKFKEVERNIFVGITVIFNFILVINICLYRNISSIHLLKLNKFIDIYFRIDKLGILFSVLVSFLWIFTAFYSMEYMKHEKNQTRFYIFFILTLGVTLGIGFSGNLFTLYIFYELLTLTTFPLVIHSGTKEALNSGKKYLIYSFIGATLVLLGMILMFSLTKNLDFKQTGILNNLQYKNLRFIFWMYMSMFIGFGVKSALVPFHSWLPEAMVAPTPVSALLHAVAVVKSGSFSIVRITYYIFGANVLRQTKANVYASFLIVVTILLGSFLALHQENLKKRLAYSTISQLGYILLGVVLLNKEGFLGGLLHLINHALIKITLFFVVGTIMYTTGKTTINEIEGIGKKMPSLMICFTVAAISLIGIPPTNGFVSKWFLAQGGLCEGKTIFPVILLLSAVLTALYILPIVIIGFFKKSDTTNIKEACLEIIIPKKMLVPIFILTTIVIILGLFPNPIIYFIKQIISELML